MKRIQKIEPLLFHFLCFLEILVYTFGCLNDSGDLDRLFIDGMLTHMFRYICYDLRDAETLIENNTLMKNHLKHSTHIAHNLGSNPFQMGKPFTRKKKNGVRFITNHFEFLGRSVT